LPQNEQYKVFSLEEPFFSAIVELPCGVAKKLLANDNQIKTALSVTEKRCLTNQT
jgi:hypothetical protein